MRLQTIGKPSEQFLRLKMQAVATGDRSTRAVPAPGAQIVTLQLKKRAGVSAPVKLVFDGALTHLLKDKFELWLEPEEK